MRVKDHHVFYSSIDQIVTVLFESENSETIRVLLPVNQAMTLGRDLSNVLNPTHENDPDPGFRTSNGPK